MVPEITIKQMQLLKACRRRVRFGVLYSPKSNGSEMLSAIRSERLPTDLGVPCDATGDRDGK